MTMLCFVMLELCIMVSRKVLCDIKLFLLPLIVCSSICVFSNYIHHVKPLANIPFNVDYKTHKTFVKLSYGLERDIF